MTTRHAKYIKQATYRKYKIISGLKISFRDKKKKTSTIKSVWNQPNWKKKKKTCDIWKKRWKLKKYKNSSIIAYKSQMSSDIRQLILKHPTRKPPICIGMPVAFDAGGPLSDRRRVRLGNGYHCRTARGPPVVTLPPENRCRCHRRPASVHWRLVRRVFTEKQEKAEKWRKKRNKILINIFK